MGFMLMLRFGEAGVSVIVLRSVMRVDYKLRCVLVKL